jgi:hypothetical protein
MKSRSFKTVATAVALAMLAGSVSAQDLQKLDLPEGAIAPSNLSELGSAMKKRVSGIVLGEEAEKPTFGGTAIGMNIFDVSMEEDPIITEIKQLAKETESQRAVMMKIYELQNNLIDFARVDPRAAVRSRLPISTCELAIPAEICDKMSWSFLTGEDIIIRQN